MAKEVKYDQKSGVDFKTDYVKMHGGCCPLHTLKSIGAGKAILGGKP